jgi:hypothetical protein
MSGQQIHIGKCFCGAVELEVTGEPVAMGYCHCDSCRKWSAGPVNAFTLWPPAAVRVIKGADAVDGFEKSETSLRKWCRTCGGHLFTEHELWDVTDVYAATIPGLDFKPALHVNYETSVLHIFDGLPKYADMPSDMGGSGKQLAE